MATSGCQPSLRGSTGILSIILNVGLLMLLLGVTLLPRTGDSTEEKSDSNVKQTVDRILRKQSNEDLLREVVEKIQRDLTPYYGMPKPACRLASVPSYTASEGVVTLSWDTVSETTFMEDGLKNEDGSVVVLTGGYYYVYSQIVYQGNGTRELDHGRIIHNVLKRNVSELDESPTVLMQNLQSTPTLRRGRQAYITSSLGGTFYLEKNSRVSITSSIPQNIDTAPSSTYYGLFPT